MTTTTAKKLTKAQWLLLDVVATEGGTTHVDADAYKALGNPNFDIADSVRDYYRARNAKRAAVQKTARTLEERGFIVRFDYIQRKPDVALAIRTADGVPSVCCTNGGIALTEAGYAALGRTGTVAKLVTLRRMVGDIGERTSLLLLSDVADSRVINRWYGGYDNGHGYAYQWKIDYTAPNGGEAKDLIMAEVARLERIEAEKQAAVNADWDEAKAYDATLPRGTLATPPNLSWAPEVIADSSGQWCGNALRFATKEEAEANVRDLSWRWMLVRETRVVESKDPVNYQWDVEKGLVAVRKEG